MKYLFIVFLLLGGACIEKKTFSIPNDYHPDYKAGDTLVFIDSTGNVTRIYCTLSLHEYIKDKTKEHDYTIERYQMDFKDSNYPPKVVAQIGIRYNLLGCYIPIGLLSYTLRWDSLGIKIFPRKEMIDGKPYEKVVDLTSAAKASIPYHLKYDLYKGILAYDDTAHVRWYFKELKRKP